MPTRWLAAVSSLVVVSAAMPNPAAAKIRAIVVQWGEVAVLESDKTLGPEYQEHSLSPGREVTWSKYINHNDHVPAQLCRGFGFEAWLVGGVADAMPSRVLLRVSHPLQTRPDGATSTQDTLLVPVRNGSVGSSYTFDEPWEVQAGEWTFDVVLDGDVLASKAFMLAPPQPGTPVPECPGRPVS